MHTHCTQAHYLGTSHGSVVGFSSSGTANASTAAAAAANTTLLSRGGCTYGSYGSDGFADEQEELQDELQQQQLQQQMQQQGYYYYTGQEGAVDDVTVNFETLS
jgi:hypothetical protein